MRRSNVAIREATDAATNTAVDEATYAATREATYAATRAAATDAATDAAIRCGDPMRQPMQRPVLQPMTGNKPAACSGCPYETDGVGFVPDTIVLDPLFVLQGDRPWKTEAAFGQPFAGQAGFVLKQWGIGVVPALKMALDRQRISLCNTLRCLPRSLEESQRKQRSREHAAAVEHCRVHATAAPSATHVLLGEVAQRAYFAAEMDAEDAAERAAGREIPGIMGRIGRVYKRNGVRFVFAPHPSWVLRSPRMVAHLQRALSIAAEPMQPIEVQPCSISDITSSVIGCDAEWGWDGRLSVIGFAADEGRRAWAANWVSWLSAAQQMLDSAQTIVGHNWHGADLRQLARDGVAAEPLEPKVFDTMLAMHATHPHLAGAGSFDIRSVVLLLGPQGGRRFPLDWKDYAGDIFKTCREDAAAALWCHAPLRRLIAAYKVEHTVELSHKIAPIFARMTERGVRLDTTVLQRIHQERSERVATLVARYGLAEKRGVKKVREVPVWRSTKILDIFEKVAGVRPPDRRHKTWLALAAKQSLAPEARELAEVLTELGKGANDAHWLGNAEENQDGDITFDKLDAAGYIHPRYRIDGSPDRPVARDPNIQNFPRPKDDPRSTPLRAAVIPYNEDEALVSADFGSIETYTNAVAADDWDMVRAIQAGERSHEQMAEMCSKIVGRPFSRFEGKTANHAADKGESPGAAARRIFGVERASRAQRDACAAVFAALLQRFPKTAIFRDRLWEQSQDNPMVMRDVFGRRMECFARSKYGSDDGGWAPRHDAKLKYWCPCKACAPRRERWKTALAFVGRAPAVTVLLLAMHRIWSQRCLDMWSLPVAEVHDELLYSVDKVKATQYCAMVVEAFKEPVPQMNGLRLPVDAKIGSNWAECK